MNSSVAMLIVLASIVVTVLMIAGWWKMFEKADEAGWKSIVPFYNTYTYFRIAGKSGWMFLLLLLPAIGFVVHIMVSIDLAKSFGKGAGYGVFLLGIFPFFGAVGLGFGEDKYIGTKHE